MSELGEPLRRWVVEPVEAHVEAPVEEPHEGDPAVDPEPEREEVPA